MNSLIKQRSVKIALLFLLLAIMLCAPSMASNRIATGSHSLVIDSDGNVWASGSNSSGQLGNNSVISSTSPVKVQGLEGAIEVAVGRSHSLALLSDGTVWAWGSNANGELGNNTTTPSLAPQQVPGLEGVIAISAGNYHNLALLSDGTVWAWGSGQMGQTGQGGPLDCLVPQQIYMLSDIVSIAAGGYHNLAVSSNGAVWVWGMNNLVQLGDVTYYQINEFEPIPFQLFWLSNVVSVSAGASHSMALKADGTVLAWGDTRALTGTYGSSAYYLSDVPVAGLNNVVAIACGVDFCLATKSDGTVWAWGANFAGQLGNNGAVELSANPIQVSGLAQVSQIAAGCTAQSAMALLGDGTVKGWGLNNEGNLGDQWLSFHRKGDVVPFKMSDEILSAVVDRGHGILVKKTGVVYVWGSSEQARPWERPWEFPRAGQFGAPYEMPGLATVVQVASGHEHNLVLKQDGTIWSWGQGYEGQLGNNTQNSSATATLVAGGGQAKMIAAAGYHSMALRNDGTVWVWGLNKAKQGDPLCGILGNTADLSKVPIQIAGLPVIVSIATGKKHCVALDVNGEVWAWGGNDQGQLGNNSFTSSIVPVRVANLDHVVEIRSGDDHLLALKEDGSVWTWGSNSAGQLGNNSLSGSNHAVEVSGIEAMVSIGAGSLHSLAIDGNGRVRGWGSNEFGQLGGLQASISKVPVVIEDLEGVLAVDGGVSSSVAVRQDGSMVTWGAGVGGQLGGGIEYSNVCWTPTWTFQNVNSLHHVEDLILEYGGATLRGVIGDEVAIKAEFPIGLAPGRVDFYSFGQIVGSDSTYPFEILLPISTWGKFQITAIGIDSTNHLLAKTQRATVAVSYDEDNDGLPDWWEHKYHNTLSHGATDDLDNDGLTEAGEYFHGTSPADGDTDDDSSSDGAEFAAQYGLVPTNVAVAEAKANTLTLAWQCSYPYETSFLIEKSENGSTWTTAGSAAANATSYTVTGLTEKTTYQFRVTTVSLYGNGKSAPVSGATKPAKPLSPSQLAVVTSSGAEVTLSWVDGSGNETGFVVEGKEDGASSFQVLATASANATLATVSGLTGSSAYLLRVKSVNSDGTDTESSAASQELNLPALPTPPASFTLLSELWNQCRLEWSLPTDSTRSGVRVFGFDSSGTIERLRINLDKDSEEFTDTGLVAATGYQYQVASVNLRGESVVSLQSVTTGAHVPLPATGLVLTPMGPRSMKVEWTDNANNETSYVVERATTSGASTWLPSPVLPANTVAYLDNVGLQGAGTYYYRVRAVNENGSSVSAEATGTTASYSGSNHAPDVLGVLQDLTMNGMSAVTTQVPLPYSTGYIEGAKDGEFLFAPKSGGGGSTLYVSRVIAPVGSPPVDTLRVEYFTGSGWALAGNLTTPASSSGYGTSVAVSGNRLYVGAPGANDANGVASGMVYFVDFSINASNQLVVSPTSRLAGVVGAAGDQFGTSVAVDGSRLIVGAPGRDKPSSGGAIVDAGAVQLYDWSGSAWVHNRTEYSPTAMAGDQFGFSVSLRARNYVVGAPYEDLPLTTSYTLQDSGAIYLGRWDSVATLRWLPNLFVLEPAVASKVTGLNQSHFGFSVAIDSYMRVAVGRPDSTWQVSDNMSDWDRGNVMLLQWNGELGDEYVILRRSIVAGGLSAGSRFGEYVEESQGYDFAIRTALRDVSNRPGVFYTVLAMAARPGQLVGSVETSRRVGTAIGLDEDHDPLTFSIPTASNPLSSHFEFGADRVLRAKSTLGTVADGFYTLYATVADDRGGSLTKPLLLYVLGVEDANDADRDGIPDAWELANGLDSNSVFDALSDLDGDGYSALEEYQRFLSGQTSGVDPRSWDLDPDGDIDGDSIVNRLDADPRNPAVGSLGIEITAPVNLQTL